MKPKNPNRKGGCGMERRKDRAKGGPINSVGSFGRPVKISGMPAGVGVGDLAMQSASMEHAERWDGMG